MTSTSGITSSGLGSGLDVDGIVSKLISADRSSQDTRLARIESKAQVQISAFGAVKSATSQLQTALNKLTAGGDLGKRLVSVGDSSVLSATASKSAQPGETQVEVLALASAHKMGSSAFASMGATVGAGSITIGIGAGSFVVSTTATSTVTQLRDAINNASDNVGVNATLIPEDGGVRLVLTSRNTGTANALTVSSGLATFSNLQSPTDAQIKVDGYTRTSAYNRISNIVDGVSVDLIKAKIGSPFTLKVTADDEASNKAVAGFVEAYNSLMSTYSSLTGYDAATSTAGVLMGDAGMRSAAQSLRMMLGSSVDASSFKTLSAIGISTQVDGSLKLDALKLATAIADDGAAVSKLFRDVDGIATRMNTLINGLTKADGQIETKLGLLEKQIAKIADDREALDTRMDKQEALYRRQFNALDSVVSRYSNMATYLDQMDQERYKLKS